VKLDFWNNPIIVSAFRVKYRRGGLFFVTTIHLLVLTGAGMFLWRYDDPKLYGPWHRNYFVAIFGVQLAFSGLIAVGTTSASIRSEVTSRTLDFQRIATLSPRSILIGKLLGEPALAYLLAIATVPLTFYCWVAGLPGISLAVWVLLYVNVATSTLMVGTMGMIQRLEPFPGKSASGGGAGGGMLAIVLISQYIAAGIALASGNRTASVAGLVTPIPALAGVFQGDPWWRFSLHIFGFELPLIIATPVAQLFVSYLCFEIMARRLVNSLNTAFGKKLAYVVLLLIDLLAASTVFGPFSISLANRCVTFCLVHLIASLWLIDCITPWKESLQSWVWRLRGSSNRLVDLLIGERSANTAVLFAFAALGTAALFLLVVVPGGMSDGFAEFRLSWTMIASAWLTMVLLILALGVFEQWCVFNAGREGRAVYIFLTLLLVLPIQIAGAYYDNKLMLAFTPSAHFAAWLSGSSLVLAPLFVTYGLLLAMSWYSMRRRFLVFVNSVDQKIALMGGTVAAISSGMESRRLNPPQKTPS
jgi:hypothetical protein